MLYISITLFTANGIGFFFYMNIKTTIGPFGPWVANLRKRSKVTVEPLTEDH